MMAEAPEESGTRAKVTQTKEREEGGLPDDHGKLILAEDEPKLTDTNENERIRRQSAPQEKISLTEERCLDAMREIGILLMAFAPLDGTIQKDVSLWTVIGLAAVGFFLFVLSVVIERRLQNA